MSDALAAKAPSTDEKPSATDRPSGFATDAAGLPLPRTFGRLILLKLLARGGMGDVYLAATTGIEGAERPIVVKTVRRDHIHDGSFLARFLDEARVQSQLNHPGVAQILEASTDESGEPYTVVEYVEGRSLADVRHRAIQVGVPIGWPEAVAIAIEMSQALAHVHERAGTDGTPLGIVHRDLSPQNVMIGHAGEVKLIDFGTARGHNRRCHTVAGVVFAKPGYVAPEVARQQVGDARIDIYALGVMLWELCAGKRLLSGEAQKHLEEVAAAKFEIPALAASRDVPAELDAVIQKLCANDPDDRVTSASRAVTELVRVLALAPAGANGERSTRARIETLMKQLWPHEPARSRSEFAKLLKQARELRPESVTPPASGIMAVHAANMTGDPFVLAGTPYRLLRKIGEGASGEVYEAEHVELGRKYAVKVLVSAHAAAHDAVDRFRREARAIAKLSHPNLVRLHDFGKSLDGRVFLAMELLRGQTLDVYAEKGVGWRRAAELAIQATHALEAAHDAGLVHRDLKPQNLFLTTKGDLKLLDFGVAMALAETTLDAGDTNGANEAPRRRQKGFAVFGTPEYMAPEQVAGETVDARCDLYALGCVLYELVTGTRPFEGSAVVVMGKQLRETPEVPRQRAPHAVIPGELEAVILKTLAKSKDDRYPNARALREALEAACDAPVRRRSRARGIAAVALAASLGVLGLAGYKTMVPDANLAELPSKLAALGSTLGANRGGETASAEATALEATRAVAGGVASEVATGEEAVEASEAKAAEVPATHVTAATIPAVTASDETAEAARAAKEPAPATPSTETIPAVHAVDDRPKTNAPASDAPANDAKPTRAPADTEARVARADAPVDVPNVAVDTSADGRSVEDIAKGTAPNPEKIVQRSSLHASSEANDKLAEARARARSRSTDPRALEAWAVAAMQAGELREARRAAESWAVHDNRGEPRFFLAAVLDASGRRREARATLEEWLSNHPSSVDARRMLRRLGTNPEPAIKRGRARTSRNDVRGSKNAD